IQMFVSGAGVGQFYNLVDKKRLLNFEWLDFRDLFEAEREAGKGKHYNVVPVLWRQLRQAYLHGCWRAAKWVAQLFAKENVKLKHWTDAVHHTIASGDDSLCSEIADGVLSERRVETVRAVVARLIDSANLRKHFVIAAKLLSAIADAIPDADVASVGLWYL